MKKINYQKLRRKPTKKGGLHRTTVMSSFQCILLLRYNFRWYLSLNSGIQDCRYNFPILRISIFLRGKELGIVGLGCVTEVSAFGKYINFSYL